MIGDAPPRGIGDPAQNVHMGPVASHSIADNGDLHIRVGVDKITGDRLQKLNAFLRRVEAGGPIEEDGARIDIQPEAALEFPAIFLLGGEYLVFPAVGPCQMGAVFRIHVRCRGVDNGPGGAILIFGLHLLADAGRNNGTVHEVVVYHFPEETFAHKIYHRGILYGRGLAIDALPALIDGQIEIMGIILPPYPSQMFQGQVGGEDVMDGMEDRQSGFLGVGGNDPARHPVVTVDDEFALMLGPNRLDDIVDNIPLKLRRRKDGVAGIGAHTVGEDG